MSQVPSRYFRNGRHDVVRTKRPPRVEGVRRTGAPDWDGLVAEAFGPPAGIKEQSRIRRQWQLALGVSVAVHLVLVGTSLDRRDSNPSPAPGTSSPVIEMNMLLAWPEAGDRVASLGSERPSVRARGMSGFTRAQRTSVIAVAQTPVPRAPDPAPVSDPDPAMPVVEARESPERFVVDSPPSTPSASAALWESTVRDHIVSTYARYPYRARRRGEQGTVQVRFVLDRQGNVLSADVINSQSHALLDGAALELVRRASPLPQPPPEVPGETVELVVPVEFALNRIT